MRVSSDPDSEREAARLTELASYQILDATPGAAFDAIVEAATLIAQKPMAAIGLIDDTREWFVAAVGLDMREVPREYALCDAVVRDRGPVVVEDLTCDDRFVANPLAAEAGVRFFAGFPLTTPSGMVLGSLCVADSSPGSLDPAQLEILSTLADQAMAQIELRRQSAAAYEARDSLRARNEVLDAVLDSIDVGILVCDTDLVMLEHNDLFPQLMGAPAPDVSALVRSEPAGLMPLRRLDGTPLPDDERPMVQTLRDGHLDGLEILTGQPENERTVRIHGTSLAGSDGSVIGAMIVAHDLTEDRRRERQLAIQISHVEQLAEASRNVLTSREPGRVACEAVLAMTEAQQVSLSVPDGSGNLVISVATEERMLGMSVPLTEDTPMGRAFWDGKPLRVDLGEAPTRGPAMQVIEEIYGPPRGALFLPLTSSDECLGVLMLTTGEWAATPSERVVGLVDVLAGELATALQRDKLGRELASQASTDPLTGLANRRDWDRRLAESMTFGEAPQCLAVLDLDLFKAFNDTLGHQAGDRLLASLAAAWRGAVRGADVLARLGGEEFGLLLTGCALPDAVTILDTLRGLVPDGQTVSVGVAQLRPGEGATSWYARADKALYRAKTTGRDRVCVDDEPSPDRRRFPTPHFSAPAPAPAADA